VAAADNESAYFVLLALGWAWQCEAERVYTRKFPLIWCELHCY